MAKKSGYKVDARVSSGMPKSQGNDYFPKSSVKSFAQSGEGFSDSYPDTVDSIMGKQSGNSSKLKKNKKDDWYLA